MKPMTNRERIEAVLAGQQPDMIPFTTYFDHLPRGEVERTLRNNGLAIIEPMYTFNNVYPHVTISRKQRWENNQVRIRETWETPKGSIWRDLVFESGYGSEFTTCHYIKDERDYEILEFILRDLIFQPNFEAFFYVEKRLGQDGMVLVRTPRTPYQQLMIEWLGVERLTIDLHEQCDGLMRVFRVLEKKEEDFIDILTTSPGKVIWIPDNITKEMIGAPRFEKYCIKSYKKYSRALKGLDKLISVHMDGKLAGLAENIKHAPVDIVEAFTPPPDGDLSICEAQEKWPDKILWLNFTSSMHLASNDEIALYTRSLVSSLHKKAGLLVGVTENIPSYRWMESLATILSVLRETTME